jgi:serine/threonine protein kinase
MLDYLKDRGDIIQNLINFTNVQPLEGLLHDYNQKVKLFPPKISKKHLLSDFDINQLSNSMIFCSKSGLASLCTYSYTIINQFSFNVNYFSSSVENIAAELETLNKIKSHTNGSHCLPLLIHHNNYDSYITMFFEVYPMNFMVYLTNNSNERKSINELQLFKWSKSLIKSFAILESLDIVHGNVTPHNIYINSEFKLKIYNFKSQNPRVRTSYPSPENLIQDSYGYYPENNEFIDDTKHDVFALGLVLLQIYDYESIVNLNFDQNLINSRISRVSYQWLNYLLNYMLNLNAEQRPTFNQLKDIIKN